jgi:hypothetical protein
MERQMMKITQLSFLCSTTTLFAFGSTMGADFLLKGDVGFADPKGGDVSSSLVGSGVDLGGEGYFLLSEIVGIGGEAHLTILGGQTFQGIDFTDLGLIFAFEAGGRVHYPSQGSVKPFIGATVGRGGLAWGYSAVASPIYGVDADGVGFWFVAPNAGIDFMGDDGLVFAVRGRYLFTSYDGTTSEGLIFDFTGGDFLQLSVGLGFRF